jgi:pimeloyl-ACP methyl ester carboxylesterase
MFVQEDGPAGGPAVLLVHAAGGWSGTWRPTMEALARAGFRAIAVDMPPLGYSLRPAAPRYGREDQARRLLGVLDALDVTRAVVVGLSFGGRAATEAAMMAPDRVSALVLVDAALSLPREGEAPAPSGGLLAALLGTPVLGQVASATLSSPLLTHRLLTLFVHDPRSATPEWVSIYQRPLTVRGTTAAVASWLPGALAKREPARSLDPASYAAVPMPTLIIWGAEDTITPPSDARRLSSLIPNAQLVMLPDVGHLPPLEDTRAFNAALIEFLETNRAAKPGAISAGPGPPG